MAGAPDCPTIWNEPPLGFAGAGLGPGACAAAPPAHGPDWHPAPQWEAVLPQYPYMEQQDPCGQLPQVVPPFAWPHDPSVVTPPFVACDVEDGDDITGSPVVVEEGGWLCAILLPPDEGCDAPAHPFWHPFAGEQCPSVEPQ